ncbi:protein lifeguard 1 isoform X8 [Canis lupus familiaris]|uniref:protein lifeguard 1 isoform X8 n=1 Tax=Canis lupus familiaris TaxID=9615 RepID=UPI0018F35186|nr:protein lifeguard 1 isoform X8 [Canis lupus familiaris]
MEMDLEVREPIDFSSGDHQHLVRKAADSNIHTKAGQPYATSPSEAPKTHGNPRPKTREQMDIYVVQISDETTPDDSNNLANPFSDSWIRRAFIIKVFLILSAQLVVTGAIVSVFLFWPAFFVVLIVLACCGKLRRQVPANYILLGLFTSSSRSAARSRISFL